jgi:hypothetical protein
MKLQQLHTQYNTDKGTAHSYIDLYDQLFEPYQHATVNFLEIGALTCGSLKMFHTYFSKAHIMGVDNWSQQADHEGNSFISMGIDLAAIIQDVTRNYPRVQLITCDSTDPQQVATKFGHTKLDLIVDDGDHHPHSQLQTFINFWPYWNSHTGVYIIEDVIDLNYLKHIMHNHVHAHAWPVKLEAHAFLKNNRGDDNVLVIQPA